jgi:hypothetical protein
VFDLFPKSVGVLPVSNIVLGIIKKVGVEAVIIFEKIYPPTPECQFPREDD